MQGLKGGGKPTDNASPPGKFTPKGLENHLKPTSKRRGPKTPTPATEGKRFHRKLENFSTTIEKVMNPHFTGKQSFQNPQVGGEKSKKYRGPKKRAPNTSGIFVG